MHLFFSFLSFYFKNGEKNGFLKRQKMNMLNYFYFFLRLLVSATRWGTPCLLSGLLFSFGVWLVVFVGLWGVNILRVGHFGVIGFFIFSLFVINELL